MLAFSINTGSECNEHVQRNATMNPSCSITTKTVMGLLDSRNLLDMHRHVLFDNWFNSVELLLEMLARDMYGVGTVRTNRKGLPKAVVGKHVRLKKGETMPLEWSPIMLKMDKRPVTMLSTIHEAAEVVTKRKCNGEILFKPIIVHCYNNCMNSVDKTDHLLSSYVALKGNKWYRKLFLHIFNMILLNSYILNHIYGEKILSHAEYREYMASHLITTSLPHAKCTQRRQQAGPELEHGRLDGKHFPIKVGSSNN